MNTSSSHTESPLPWTREGILETFYKQCGPKFDDIWKLLRGGTERSLIGKMSKDKLALQLDEIISPALRRRDAVFKERQEQRAQHGIPVAPGETYFEMVKQGIQAAESAAENTQAMLLALMTFDKRHLEQFFSLTESESRRRGAIRLW